LALGADFAGNNLGSMCAKEKNIIDLAYCKLARQKSIEAKLKRRESKRQSSQEKFSLHV
jgi:hypothetical protein